MRCVDGRLLYQYNTGCVNKWGAVMLPEKWVKIDVIGPECEINTSGQVRQKEMVIEGVLFKNVIKKPTLNSRNRLFIQFTDGVKKQRRSIHLLVAETFIPNPGGKNTVVHLDGNLLNNHVNNLEWRSISPALKKAREDIRGDSHHSAILKEDDVREIKRRIAKGDKPSVLAEEYGVHRSLISHIIAGRRRKGVR